VEAALGEGCGDFAVSCGRPAFGAPAGAGEENRSAASGELSVGPYLGGRVTREDRREIFERWGVGEDGVGKLQVLLDDVGAAVGDAFGEQKACQRLARHGLADAAGGVRPAHGPGGAHRPLHVHDDVVLGSGEFATDRASFTQRGRRQRRARPFPKWDEVKLVDQRLRFVTLGTGIG